MNNEDRRSDADLRRLFDKLESQEKVISALATKLEIFVATRDIEFKHLKEEQEKIEKNQECIIMHLNKFKRWMFAGSVVVVVVVGLGKAVFWIYEHAPVFFEYLIDGARK